MRILFGPLAMAVALWTTPSSFAPRTCKSDRAISSAVVVVVGNKIQSVGSTITQPAGAEVIDLGDATILPGFSDAHTHLSHPYSTDFRQRIIESE